MTAPVDIAAAVELARRYADELEQCEERYCSGGSLKHGGVCGNCEGLGTVGPTIRAEFARALLALADERAHRAAALSEADREALEYVADMICGKAVGPTVVSGRIGNASHPAARALVVLDRLLGRSAP